MNQYITGIGDAIISCCGIVLPSLDVEKEEEEQKHISKSVRQGFSIIIAISMGYSKLLCLVGEMEEEESACSGTQWKS